MVPQVGLCLARLGGGKWKVEHKTFLGPFLCPTWCGMPWCTDWVIQRCNLSLVNHLLGFRKARSLVECFWGSINNLGLQRWGHKFGPLPQWVWPFGLVFFFLLFNIDLHLYRWMYNNKKCKIYIFLFKITHINEWVYNCINLEVYYSNHIILHWNNFFFFFFTYIK